MDRETLNKWNKTPDEWRDTYYALLIEHEQQNTEKYELEQKLSNAEYLASNAQEKAQREVKDMRARLEERTGTPQMWKKYRLGDCPLPLLQVIEEISLPTEFVIKEPKWLEPQKARVYSTKHYLHNNEIKTYEELRYIPEFNDTSHCDEVIVVEQWEDWGDDGHVHNVPVGLVITSQNEWNKLKEIAEKAKYYDVLHLLRDIKNVVR